jgi:hypothetical protein
MTGNSFRSNVLPEMSDENEQAARSLSDGPWRRVVSLDGHDWGVYTDSGIRNLGSRPRCTVGSKVMQQAVAASTRGSDHHPTGGQYQTEERPPTSSGGTFNQRHHRLLNVRSARRTR